MPRANDVAPPPPLPEADEMLRLCELVYEDIGGLVNDFPPYERKQNGNGHRNPAVAVEYTDVTDISDARWDVDAFVADRRPGGGAKATIPRVQFGGGRPTTERAPHPPAADIVVAVRLSLIHI